MRRIEEYKRLEDDRLHSKGQSPAIKLFLAGHFSLKATKGLKDTGIGSTNGGSERGIQGTSTQDRRLDQERAVLQVAK